MKKELKKQIVDQEIDKLERKLARQIVKDLQEQIGPEKEVWVLGLALEREKLRKNQRNKRDKEYTGYTFIIENELSRENKPSYTMLLGREY